MLSTTYLAFAKLQFIPRYISWVNSDIHTVWTSKYVTFCSLRQGQTEFWHCLRQVSSCMLALLPLRKSFNPNWHELKVAFSQKGLMRLSFLQTVKPNYFPELKGDTAKQALKHICQCFFNFWVIFLKLSANASFFNAVWTVQSDLT